MLLLPFTLSLSHPNSVISYLNYFLPWFYYMILIYLDKKIMTSLWHIVYTWYFSFFSKRIISFIFVIISYFEKQNICSPECRSFYSVVHDFCMSKASLLAATLCQWGLGGEKLLVTNLCFVCMKQEACMVANRLWDSVEDMTTPCFSPRTSAGEFQVPVKLSPSLSCWVN